MALSVKHIALLAAGLILFGGCSLVDEDVSDCQTDYSLDYEMQLVTNMTTQLQTELSMATDVVVYSGLQDSLKLVFTDYAHDIDLGFYDVVEDSLRLNHVRDTIDATKASYSLNIPVRRYMHLATANLDKNSQVSLENELRCHSARFHQQVRDTLNPHEIGIFSARLMMDVQKGLDQHFDVNLYMANCAEALVLDTLESGVKDIKVFATGFATDFALADSTYHYDFTPVFRTKKVEATAPGSKMCFYSVNFPSRSVPDISKAIIQTEDPDVSESAENALWQFRVYATLPSGKVTETLLGVRRPIQAGQVRIVKAKVFPDGSLEPGDAMVTVTVTLDWTPGMEHEVVL